MNRAFAVVVPKCCKGLLGWIDILHDQSRLGCLKTKCGGSGVRKAFTRSPQLLDIAACRLAQQKRIGAGEHQVVAVAEGRRGDESTSLPNGGALLGVA